MNKLLEKIKKSLDHHPAGLYVLFYTEMWELFGRVGITAILALYLTKTLHFSDTRAFEIYSGFIALIFITPIIGGILCDKFLGNRHAIILGGGIMAAGNLLLIIPNVHMLYIGLATLAIGSGFFLPSITPLVGYLYDDNDQKRDAGFTIFYIAKNMGYFLAPICCGLVSSYLNYNYAFALSAIGMLSGIIVFIKGRKHLHDYGKAPTTVRRKIHPNLFIYIGSLACIPLVTVVLRYQIDGYVLGISSTLVCGIMFYIATKRSAQERRHLLAILTLMIFVLIFSSCLGQGGTTLNLFIERIINRHMLNFQVPTPIFYALDPVFMFILGPVLAAIWVALAKRNREPHISLKFALASLLLGIGFFIFVMAAIHAQKTGHASMLYVTLAYSIFPLAELCIIPIGLSMVTRLAPKDLTAMLVGVWMLSYAASGYFTGKISLLGQIAFPLSSHTALKQAAHIYHYAFLDTVGILCLAAIALFLLRNTLKRLMQ